MMRPRDAFLGHTRRVKRGDAAGEIAAEAVSPYPPGVPVVVPGQRITPTIVRFLEQGMAEGMYVKGANDPSLEELRVVAIGAFKRGGAAFARPASTGPVVCRPWLG